MSDANGIVFEPTGDERVDAALQRLSSRMDGMGGMLKDLQDALIVNAHLEKRQSERLDHHDELLDQHRQMLAQHAEMLVRHNNVLVNHQEFITQHEESLARHEKIVSSHEEFAQYHDLKMREIDEKLNALVDIIMRRERGPEARE
jgi:uncharacterized protein YaaR (DUF327 family)